MATSHDITSYGKRLLPHIVDERARSGYERPYAMFPRSVDPAEGFRSISYACIANAVNRACWWLDAELSRDDEKEYAFAYLGSNDLRYIILVLATMKTSRKVRLPILCFGCFTLTMAYRFSSLPSETPLRPRYRCLKGPIARFWFHAHPWLRVYDPFLPHQQMCVKFKPPSSKNF
jgi:hypothetical protein